VPDGSLSGGENSGEIVSPVLGYDDIEELQNIIRAVRTAGARTDHSTGIHIHVDGARFDAKSVVNLVKLVHKQERLLEHALGVSEQRLARYCRPIEARFIERLEARRPKTMQEVSDAWYGRSGETRAATTAAATTGSTSTASSSGARSSSATSTARCTPAR
jgi:hypothetical protein